jgi:hypothetical protein
MDEVLSVSPRFGVGHWIYYARNMLPEMDDWTRDLFEFNARTLITTWGGMKNSSLVDYSNRQWAGLTSGLYLPRWERFVNAHRAAIFPGGSLSLPSASSFFLQEWEWANRKSDETGYYSTVGVGNLQELAQRVWDEFSCAVCQGLFHRLNEKTPMK